MYIFGRTKDPATNEMKCWGQQGKDQRNLVAQRATCCSCTVKTAGDQPLRAELLATCLPQGPGDVGRSITSSIRWSKGSLPARFGTHPVSTIALSEVVSFACRVVML